MTNFLNRLLRGGQAREPDEPSSNRRRLSFDAEPAAIYAIGDVHGRLDLLLELQARILEDGAKVAGDKWIVTLGDHIDRGPESAAVLDRLMEPPPEGWRSFSLLGNHELEMQKFVARPRASSGWLEFGGVETLISYGMPSMQVFDENLKRDRWRQLVDTWIPPEHLAWLDDLPVLIETPGYLFVHAGIVPGLPLAQQHDLDLVGFRDDFTEDFGELGKVVVHGHQVRRTPLVTASRIGIDTGAYATGILTAVRLMPGRPPLLLATGASTRRRS